MIRRGVSYKMFLTLPSLRHTYRDAGQRTSNFTRSRILIGKDMKIFWIAVAGAIGTLMRWWFAGVVQKAAGGVFPWGTFAVNMAGCFLFGAVWSLAEERMLISPLARIVILSGFMGAFTTFSSYMFETASLMRDSQWFYAFGNIALQNVTGIIFMALGFVVGRAL